MMTRKRLTAYFEPKKNKEFERYEFRNLKQFKDETIDQFATRLLQKSENCEFADKDGEIKSQIIQGCFSQKLHAKYLEEDKTLKDMLTMARTMEIALKQAECMEKHGQNHSGSNEESIDKIRSSKSLRKQPLKHFPRQQPVRNGPVNRPRTATNQGNQKCRNCGGQRRIKLQDSQLNEIPQYLVRPCVKSPMVAGATRDFRYQDNTGTLSPVSLERANNHDRNS